jgi:MraZ protein
MFLGEYWYTLDEKFRLTLPAKFRPQLTSGVVLTAGTDKCILVYSQEAFEVIAEKINALPLTGQDAAEFRRLMFSKATAAELDKQGRVIVPEKLRDYAELETSEVVVLGVGKHIEVWSPTRWNVMAAKIDDTASQAAIWAKLGI